MSIYLSDQFRNYYLQKLIHHSPHIKKEEHLAYIQHMLFIIDFILTFCDENKVTPNDLLKSMQEEAKIYERIKWFEQNKYV